MAVLLAILVTRIKVPPVPISSAETIRTVIRAAPPCACNFLACSSLKLVFIRFSVLVVSEVCIAKRDVAREDYISRGLITGTTWLADSLLLNTDGNHQVLRHTRIYFS